MREFFFQKSNFRCRENIHICPPLRRLRRLAIEYVKKYKFLKYTVNGHYWDNHLCNRISHALPSSLQNFFHENLCWSTVEPLLSGHLFCARHVAFQEGRPLVRGNKKMQHSCGVTYSIALSYQFQNTTILVKLEPISITLNIILYEFMESRVGYIWAYYQTIS